MKNIDINKVAVFNKISVDKKGFKYFVSYKEAKRNRPLSIFLPKMIAYGRDFNRTKYMYFLIKDHELIERYNEIWEKGKNSIKKNW